jgi:ADP-heptose:LPS heptosyltransferase
MNQVAEKSEAPVIIEDTTRRSVLDSAALIQRCDVVVGNISGPLHIADALGVPCVGLYGPHRPGRFGLLGPRARAVSLDLECSPCNNPDCKHRRCIMDISVERVFKTIEEILNGNE